MHAIAFFCSSGNQPVPGMIVQLLLDGKVLGQGITNKDGYVLFNFTPNNVMIDVYIWGPGIQNYYEQLTLGNANKNYFVTLTPSFNKPSRERIINVKANLCNVYDADGIPIFDAFITGLIVNQPTKAQDWVNKLRENGSTHVNAILTGNYPPYQIPGIDLTSDLSVFDGVLNWIKQRGLIPIVKLGFDGQAYDPNGWTYGWQWGMDNIERIADGLSSHINSVLWSTGFDGCFPDWSPDQTVMMLRKMRAVLGEKACIDTEFAGYGEWSYIHMGNGPADWSADKLGILDHFSLEAQSFPPNTGEPLQEIATRLLGPKCLIGPQEPYYLEGLNKTIAIDIYETWAYKFIRNQATPEDAVRTANECARYGFTVFGNGLPS